VLNLVLLPEDGGRPPKRIGEGTIIVYTVFVQIVGFMVRNMILLECMTLKYHEVVFAGN
jgi:hypothetical protein